MAPQLGQLAGEPIDGALAVGDPDVVEQLILFLTNQLGGAFGIALMAGIIGLRDEDWVWSAAVGAVPLVLPTAAALAIAALATRLPGRG